MSSAQRSALRIVDGVASGHSEALARSLAAGEKQDVDRFHDATSGLLFGLLLLILNDTVKADEVLSEVYDEVRGDAARFVRSQEDLLTWLITITHRRALEHLCSSREDRQFVVSVGLARAQGSGKPRRFDISKSAHRRLVAGTLASFSPVERKMIELAYFSRLDTLAIAVKLRQSTDEVNAGLRHGISQLYNLFRNQEFLVGAGQREPIAKTM